MRRASLPRTATLLAGCALLGLASLSGCGPDVETCEDQLELRFDERVARDYVLVLTIGEDTARVDCSEATYPTKDEENPVDIEVELDGTLEGRALCTQTSIVLISLTPEAGSLGIAYRLIDSADVELLESDFSAAYDEVEARDRTCRQGAVILDVGCAEGITCSDPDGTGGGGGIDLPT